MNKSIDLGPAGQDCGSPAEASIQVQRKGVKHAAGKARVGAGNSVPSAGNRRQQTARSEAPPPETAAGRDRQAATERLRLYLRLYHPGTELGELDITSTRGHWKIRTPCPGGAGCRHAFRGALGPCDGGTPLGITFAEFGRRDNAGRFLSPYAAWRVMSDPPERVE